VKEFHLSVIVSCLSSAPAISRCKTKLHLQTFMFITLCQLFLCQFLLLCIREFSTDRNFRYLQLNVFLSFHIFTKIIQLRERAFILYSYFVPLCENFSSFDRIETALKFPFKLLPSWYCSSMIVPVATQPNIQLGLSNQIHIALNLFDMIIKTVNTREELERSWTTIEQDIAFQNSWKLDSKNVETLISFLQRISKISI
jgi:hypothetical protein